MHITQHLLRGLDERPYKASAVANSLALGLPDYIAESSSKSGTLSNSESSNAESLLTSDPFLRLTTVHMWYLWCDRMDVENEDNRVKPIYI
jgi:hypothetical protein